MSFEIQLPDITAKEMADAINSVATILLQHDILSDNGFASLSKVAAEIKAFKKQKIWQLSIDRDFPVEFKEAENIIKESLNARIELSSDFISVNLANYFPFEALDISVLIKNPDNVPISRWHFDLANSKESGEMQPGPLTHIQYGGRTVGQQREDDHPLKVPRWCHPPMDVILLCEAVVANFFPKKWDCIREEPAWCDAIAKSQKICYSAYLSKMLQSLSTSSTTILHQMDANVWKRSLSA
ncbi:hypothetical protein [Acinetobacter soli]|uniref:hypothetical protein n=1 Tax=Acinetobacter soli TaxID=487316 RepID=UPI00125F1BE1|nr:hypothetical protein [Acinetobacter soli]